MFHRCMGMNVTVILVTVAAAPAVGQKPTPADQFHRAYYLEHAGADLGQATELYERVAADRGADAGLREAARARLAGCREELASADLARLMPPEVLAYLEISRPAEQLASLLRQLGLLRDESAPPATAQPKVAISPVLIRELLGLRGAAVAVTGFDPVAKAPSGVAVVHPGNLEVLRGLLETALPVTADPMEPIGGFATFKVENQAFVTVTNRLIIVSNQRSEIEDVVRRLRGEEERSLAANPALAETLKGRADALLFFCVNPGPLMPLANAALAVGGAQHRELALAQALLDLNSLRSVSGRAGVRDDGLFLEVSLNLDEGHRNLVYNLLRMPPLSRETLRCVPGGAAAFASAALNEAPSRFAGQAPGEGERQPVVTALDLGREIFANIIGLAVFVLPPQEGAARGPLPVPDAALVMTVSDPARSEALWSEALGVASLALGTGRLEGASEAIDDLEVRAFHFPEQITLYFAADGNDVVISPSKAAIARAIGARRGGSSVLDDPVFKPAVERLDPAATLLVAAHPGRCVAVARHLGAEIDDPQAERFVALLTDTVGSVELVHSGRTLRLSALVWGIPDVSGLLTEVVMEHRRRDSGAATAHGALFDEQPARRSRRADRDGRRGSD